MGINEIMHGEQRRYATAEGQQLLGPSQGFAAEPQQPGYQKQKGFFGQWAQQQRQYQRPVAGRAAAYGVVAQPKNQ